MDFINFRECYLVFLVVDNVTRIVEDSFSSFDFDRLSYHACEASFQVHDSVFHVVHSSSEMTLRTVAPVVIFDAL